jgi:hypothetical protein
MFNRKIFRPVSLETALPLQRVQKALLRGILVPQNPEDALVNRIV